MLKTNSFRKTIASAVALSVANYFSGSASLASTNDAGKTEDSTVPALKKSADTSRNTSRLGKTITYRVKRGDNLNAIAKRHETSLATLLKLNQLKKNDPLYVGRKIISPVAEPEIVSVKPVKKYTVKKGDTLFSLAKSSSITIDELRRLNNLTDSDVLLFGQKIKLPQ